MAAQSRVPFACKRWDAINTCIRERVREGCNPLVRDACVCIWLSCTSLHICCMSRRNWLALHQWGVQDMCGPWELQERMLLC